MANSSESRTSQKRNAQVKKPVRINSKKRRRRRIIKRIVIAVIVVLLAGAGIYAGPKLVKIAKLAADAKQMADDSPDNAPVQAIYSARGLEELSINYIYDFKNEQNTVALKPFEEIASVVEAKYENLLNDSKYEITRAKLYERVYTGENQKYAEEPIWYFEVVENGNNKTVTLVNAETGKEINLP